MVRAVLSVMKGLSDRGAKSFKILKTGHRHPCSPSSEACAHAGDLSEGICMASYLRSSSFVCTDLRGLRVVLLAAHSFSDSLLLSLSGPDQVKAGK